MNIILSISFLIVLAASIIFILIVKRRKVNVILNTNQYNLIMCEIKSKKSIKKLVIYLLIGILLKWIFTFESYLLIVTTLIGLFDVLGGISLMGEFTKELVLFAKEESFNDNTPSKEVLGESSKGGKSHSKESLGASSKGKSPSNIVLAESSSSKQTDVSLTENKTPRTISKEAAMPKKYVEHLEHSEVRAREAGDRSIAAHKAFLDKYLENCSIKTQDEVDATWPEEFKENESESDTYTKKQFVKLAKPYHDHIISERESLVKQMDIVYEDRKLALKDKGIYLRGLERSYKIYKDEILEAISLEKQMYKDDLKLRSNIFESAFKQAKGKGKEKD